MLLTFCYTDPEFRQSVESASQFEATLQHIGFECKKYEHMFYSSSFLHHKRSNRIRAPAKDCTTRFRRSCDGSISSRTLRGRSSAIPRESQQQPQAAEHTGKAAPGALQLPAARPAELAAPLAATPPAAQRSWLEAYFMQIILLYAMQPTPPRILQLSIEI